MLIDNSGINALGKILVLGCGGKMGRHYLDKLLEMGFSRENILGVDINQTRLEAVARSYPGIFFTLSHSQALDQKPAAAIIAVNSSAHLDEIVRCYNAGVSDLFVEKPLVYYKHELAKLGQFKNQSLFVAHLINFSEAVKELFQYIQENNLILCQAFSFWGKNWPGEKRVMGGDAEEEVPHPLALILAIAEFNQLIKDISVWARLTSVPHVQSQYLNEAEELDLGFPHIMNDTTLAQLIIKTHHNSTEYHIPAQILSSFNLAEQSRRLELGLCTQEMVNRKGRLAEPPSYKAIMEFDTRLEDGTGDYLKIINARTNESVLYSESRQDKLRANLEACLKEFAGQGRDPRLIDFKKADWLTNLMQKMLHQ